MWFRKMFFFKSEAAIIANAWPMARDAIEGLRGQHPSLAVLFGSLSRIAHVVSGGRTKEAMRKFPRPGW